jgi:hypothetical protein
LKLQSRHLPENVSGSIQVGQFWLSGEEANVNCFGDESSGSVQPSRSVGFGRP